MFGILGEDKSDADTIDVLVRRLLKTPNLKTRKKGTMGFGNLIKQGAKDLNVFDKLGCDRFIVCHDSDGADPNEIENRIKREVIDKSDVTTGVCILVPVQAIEAWILADIQAVTKVFTSWTPAPISNPESQPQPKTYLKRLSRSANGSPRYAKTSHNPKIARHLDLNKLAAKCTSFRRLRDFAV